MKIEKGMTVRIKENLEVEKKYDGVLFAEDMGKYKGYVGKIIAVDTWKNGFIFQIENCVRPDDKDLKYGKILYKLANIFGANPNDFQAKYYTFSESMVDVISEADESESKVEIEKITVDKEELDRQIKDEFINGLPTGRSIRTQITVTDLDSNLYNSQILTTLAKGQDKANFALFMATLKAVKEMAERLSDIGDYPYQVEELFDKYIDLIEEDLDEFDDTTNDI